VIGFVTLIVGARVIEAIRPMNLLWIVAGVLLAGTLTWLVRVAIGPPAPAPFLGPVKYLVLKTALTVTHRDFGFSRLEAIRSTESIESVGTASFRMDAWKEAGQRFLRNPFVGEGFGKPFVFYDAMRNRWLTEDTRPHNTYLTILYKMGLVGMAVFALIHIVFYKSVYLALYRGVNDSATAYLLAFTGAMVALQVYGFFNLLVESPFLALIYWSLMGVMITMTRLPEATSPVT